MGLPRPCLCLLLLGIVHRAVAAATGNFLRQAKSRQSPLPSGTDAQSLQVPDCSCGCCHVTYRTPDEMPEGGTVFLKCALDEVQNSGTAVETKKDWTGKVSTQPLRCGSSCSPPKEKDSDSNTTAILGMAGESGSGAIDYNRYCFYNCRPYDFTIGNICNNLPKELKKKLQDGTEVDPAIHPKVTDPDMQNAWGMATGAIPTPTKPAPTTTAPLPCEASDPCAYGMMDKSIEEAKVYYARAASKAYMTAEIARSAGGPD